MSEIGRRAKLKGRSSKPDRPFVRPHLAKGYTTPNFLKERMAFERGRGLWLTHAQITPEVYIAVFRTPAGVVRLSCQVCRGLPGRGGSQRPFLTGVSGRIGGIGSL